MKSNDLYYSGHCGGLTLVLFFFIYEKKYKRSLLALFILFFTIAFLLITNAHYLNDILIGFFMGFNIVTLFHKNRRTIEIYFLYVYIYIYSRFSK